MNILDSLEENNITDNLIYYGINDMSSGFHLSALLNGLDIIRAYYTETMHTNKDITYDDYIDFIYLETLKKLEELRPYINDAVKEKYENAINIIKGIKNNSKSQINKFIKKNYESIFNKENKKHYISEVKEYTLNYIKSNYQIFKQNINIYSFIFDKISYDVFYDFSFYKKVLENNPETCNILFSINNVIEQLLYNPEDLLEPLLYLKKKDNNLFLNVTNKIMEYTKKNFFNATADNVMNKYFKLKKIFNLFKELKISDARILEDEIKIQQSILDDYATKHAKKIRYPISFQEINNFLNDDKIEWYNKSLKLTHERKNGKLIPIISDYKKEKSFMDHVTTDRNIDDEFTYNAQSFLEIAMNLEKIIILEMINDSNLKACDFIYLGIKSYCEKNNIKAYEFNADFEILKNGILEYNKYKDNIYLSKIILIGLIKVVIGLIEKYLRAIYIFVIKSDEYFDSKYCTLERMLNDEDLIKYFNNNLLKVIEFYLTKRNETHVGKNIRNDFAHYNDNIWQLVNEDTFLTVLTLLLNLSNDLLIKAI